MRTIEEQLKSLAERGHEVEAFIVDGQRVAPADVFKAAGIGTDRVYVLWKGNNVGSCKCGCGFMWHAPHDFKGWSFGVARGYRDTMYIESGSMTVLVGPIVRPVSA